MNLLSFFRRPRKTPSPLPEYDSRGWAEDEPLTETLRAVESGYQEPHGIATEETLTRLITQAHAEAAGRVRVPAYIPQLPPLRSPLVVAAHEPPPVPCSGVSSIWVSQIAYPDPADRLSYDHARNYRETLRHIGKATGTSTSLEDTASWPRPALEAGWETFL